jgi:RNase H-like domain found in reverse transcriptase/Reverse transcriptase (RNA-dependent DNA polymerase)/Integrase zinc binding domain/Chromo (CHRromatin Organisation MOdifier) domain
MIDSGASTSFVDIRWAKRRVPHLLNPKSTPFKVSLGDGELAKICRVTEEVQARIAIGEHEESNLCLSATKLSYPVMLGISWLKQHDPWIHWSQHRITFNSLHCLSFCRIKGPTTVVALARHPQDPPPAPEETTLSTTPEESPPPTSTATVVPLALPSTLGEEKRNQSDGLRKVLPPRNQRKVTRRKVQRKTSRTKDTVDQVSPQAPKSMFPTLAPAVSMINAVAFKHLIESSNLPVFRLNISTASSEPLESDMDPDLSVIPAEYHEFAKVFSKKEAEALPEHRSYDHTIPLQEGATPPFARTSYSLSPNELEVLDKYIKDNLRKGFIRHSQSPAAAPILFVKKPDGSLRLCVDYRGLNKVTVKNRYPLPLIGELMDKCGNAKYFTSFDMRDGYNLLRMAQGEEWKTAFRCRYGLYEYCVMPFGLCNAPGTFQHFANDKFRDFLDEFLVIYLDDLLIYSNTLEEHKRHVRLVLERLQEAGLYIKPQKCQFHVKKVSFLGFMISSDGIHMDPAKVEAILGWERPKSAHDTLVFLGFANFYRRFIKNYSKIAAPLTNLTRKEVKFKWSPEAEEAFSSLKRAFCSAPILRHFDQTKPAIIEVDASDFAYGGVLSQYHDGVLHPCAFISKKFTAAELNYEIYDKEMLAIVKCMYDHWRHYLEGSGQQVQIFTDHKNLLWFTETKVYNRRQARWAEKLSRFDFTITFRPGVRQGKPDALSRRPDHRSLKGGDTLTKKHEFAFLKPSQVKDFPTKNEEVYTSSLAAMQVIPLNVDDDLAKAIQEALPEDRNIGEYLENLRDPDLPREDDVREFLEPFSMREDLVLYNGLIYIPENDDIKLQILQQCHDSPTAGHLGQAKTLELVSRNYYWPRMRPYVNDYIRSCDMCARNKAPRHKPHGTLRPLPIPPASWSSVSMDFIVELPESNGFNAILVCVDRLTKMAHFCPTTTNVTAEDTADLYLRHVFKHHGLPTDVVSDRGTQFVSRFSSRLYDLCKIKHNKSTAYHPQSDGQTERVNQVLEQYLRIFCDYQQDNWFQLLPLAEFSYNNAQHASTQMSPFFANYGFNPRFSLQVLGPTDQPQNPAAEELIARFKAIYQQVKENLTAAQAKYKENYDAHVKEAPSFTVGDLVWLSRKNITTTRPSTKLDYKRLGPYKILEVVGESKMAFKLDLPPRMKVHPVFHATLLEPYHVNTIPGRVQPPPPSVTVEDVLEYEVKEVLDSRVRNNKLEYFVDWVGYAPHERSWEPASYLDHAPEEIARYHQRYPNRPSPQDLHTRRPRQGLAGARS